MQRIEFGTHSNENSKDVTPISERMTHLLGGKSPPKDTKNASSEDQMTNTHISKLNIGVNNHKDTVNTAPSLQQESNSKKKPKELSQQGNRQDGTSLELLDAVNDEMQDTNVQDKQISPENKTISVTRNGLGMMDEWRKRQILNVSFPMIQHYYYAKRYYYTLALAFDFLSNHFQISHNVVVSKLNYPQESLSFGKDAQDGDLKFMDVLEGWIPFLNSIPLDSNLWTDVQIRTLLIILNIIKSLKLQVSYEDSIWSCLSQSKRSNSKMLVDESRDDINACILRKKSEMYIGVNHLWSDLSNMPQRVLMFFFFNFLQEKEYNECREIIKNLDPKLGESCKLALQKSIEKPTKMPTEKERERELSANLKKDFSKKESSEEFQKNPIVSSQNRSSRVEARKQNNFASNLQTLKLNILNLLRRSSKRIDILLALLGILVLIYILFRFRHTQSFFNSLKDMLKMYIKALSVLT